MRDSPSKLYAVDGCSMALVGATTGSHVLGGANVNMRRSCPYGEKASMAVRSDWYLLLQGNFDEDNLSCSSHSPRLRLPVREPCCRKNGFAGALMPLMARTY